MSAVDRSWMSYFESPIRMSHISVKEGAQKDTVGHPSVHICMAGYPAEIYLLLTISGVRI